MEKGTLQSLVPETSLKAKEDNTRIEYPMLTGRRVEKLLAWPGGQTTRQNEELKKLLTLRTSVFI